MIIEQAKQTDIPDLIRFQQGLAFETEDLTLDEETLRLGMTEIFKDPGKGRYYVARDKDKAIACLLITYEWSEWRNGTVIWIQSVYVESNYRQSGIFRMLYDHVKKMVHESPELMGIRLYVEHSNKRAQKVYEKIGMTDEHYRLFEWMK